MPTFPGFPERPRYSSVKSYLSELAKDIAEIVLDPVKMERFREQLKIYANLWREWSIFAEADHQGRWVPSMGRPECVFSFFSRYYNPVEDAETEGKKLVCSYALCALIHDSELPHLDSINTEILPWEAIEETLSAPRNTLESSPDMGVSEMYAIEQHFNFVRVDLKEVCEAEKIQKTLASVEDQIRQASQLADAEFLELAARQFHARLRRLLAKEESWLDVDRSLKGWFDTSTERLAKFDFAVNKIGLLKYHYKNLLHFTKGTVTRSFRGFPDAQIKRSACEQAYELAVQFETFAQRIKDSDAAVSVIQEGDASRSPTHPSPITRGNHNMIRLFISHSSQDKELAGKLADLLRIALRLSAQEIRCTSIDEYRLPGGAKTSEQLRHEVCEANAFIGLISTAATDSLYVVFELGARWGSDKHLLPLLGNGVSSDILKGPLSDYNALSCDNVSQLHKLVREVASILKIKAEEPDAYQRYIDDIGAIPPTVNDVATENNRLEALSEPQLSEVQVRIVKEVARLDRGQALVEIIAHRLGLSEMEAKYNLDELSKTHGLVQWIGNMNPGVPDYYDITHKGRGFVISLEKS